MANATYPAVRHVGVGNRLIALWDTVIGKKVVMAITGTALILFVIGHMIGNLKIFAGSDEINTYASFIRQAGTPELSYGQLLWSVRIVLLACVVLHITAAVQLTQMSWAARPVGYAVKRDIETTWAARTMRWGGVLLVVFVIFHLLHLTGGVVGFQPGQFKDLAVYQNVLAAFAVVARGAFLRNRDGRVMPPSQPWDLEHAANARLEHGPKRSTTKTPFHA